MRPSGPRRPDPVAFLRACPIAACWASLLSVTVAGATPLEIPTAGSRLRVLQEETRHQLRPREEPVPPVAMPPGAAQRAAAAASGATIHVEAFEVHGVTRFAPEAVAAVLQPWAGRDLDTAGLHAAADALNGFYREAGYFAARVFVPPQGSKGTVRLDVYEGYLEPGGISVKAEGRLVTASQVLAILERHLPFDRPIHRDDFERAILLAEDLPGAHVAATLYPGTAVGTARLRATVRDEASFAGNADFDNYGNEFTGRERLGTTLYFNSPGGTGDQAVARLVTSGSRSNYAYLTYLRPVSASGTRAGASLDAFRYRTDAYADLGHASGEAADLRLYVTHPLRRSRHHNLHARGELFQLRLHDRNDAGIDSKRRVSGATLRLAGDEDQDWIGHGVTTFELSATAGQASVRGDEAFREIDRTTARVDGRFARANAIAMRLQHLPGPWSLFGRASGQVASGNLEGSQKFYVGGGTSVSGYPVGEAAGDEGADLHLELRRDFRAPWGGILQGGIFWQQGWLLQHKRPWDGWQGPIPDQPNHVTLKSAGLALSQNWGAQWVVRAHVGWQVGDNPLRNPRTGQATDGSTSDFRAWIQAIRYF